MQLRAFTPTDLYQIDLQPQQQSFHRWAPPGYAVSLAINGSAYTLQAGERILACTGVLDMAAHDGLLWLFLAIHASPRMLALTRVAERFIACSGKRRLFACCELHFPPAHRWLGLLGFEPVKPLPGYGPDGADHLLYRRSVH